METLDRYLTEHPFLQGLKPEYIKLIVGCSSNVKFDAGQYIFRDGTDADNFYLIRQGKVSINFYSPEKGEAAITTVDDGDVLGWSWLIPPYKWHFDAKVLETTRAIALDGVCLRNKCEADSGLGYELMKRFAYLIEQRLNDARFQLLDLYAK